MSEESVFISLLDRLKRGRTSRSLPNERGVITGNVATPTSTPIQQKQQDFLDVQSQKIAQDIYGRSVYYDTDRIGSYNDYRAMDMSPEVSAALDIITDECLEASTLIPMLDGESKSIEALFKESAKDFWVYSINPENGKIEPALCEKVAYKGEQDVYEITFDDDSTVMATSEHLWLSKNSSEYKTTKDLSEGDSIEPFYRKISSKEDRIAGYEMLFERDGKFEYTHRIVKRKLWSEKKGVCHHKDFDKLNNAPSNLEIMDWFEHQKLHASLNSERWKNNTEFTEKMRKIFSETNSKNGPYWTNPEWSKVQREKFSKAHKKRFSKMTKEDKKVHGLSGNKNSMYGKGYKVEGEKNGRYLHSLNHSFKVNEIIEAYKTSNSIDGACEILNTNKIILRKSDAYKKLNIQRWEDIDFIVNNISLSSLKVACLNSKGIKNIKRSMSMVCEENDWKARKVHTYLNKNGFEKWGDFVDSINHSIKNIKFVGKRKTYDLVNVGEHHNFAILTSDGKSGVFSHNCVTRDERGDILSIYSENDRIKTVLKDLFYGRLNIEYNLTFWVREMVKFGDAFAKLEIDQKEGIYDARMLPVAEIHREEAFDGNVNSSRFKWDINNMYFEEFQIAHFRLVSDGTKLPYGRSVLDSARKLWKQLQLAEDAMLVYRIIRAPERRVHYIEVGNLESADVQQYVERIKRELKKSPIVDQKTGQMNLKYNPLTMEEDYFVPVRGDKSSRIETLPGASNLGEIQDVEYLQNKLFAALKVPKTYLNYSEALAGGSTLSQADLRFSRTINRIQENIVIELRRIANVHLFLLGFEDDMDNFDLKLTNPSTQQELLKLETMKARLEVFKELFTGEATSPVSYTWAMEFIMGFSKNEIKQILRQKKVEKKMFAEIDSAVEEYANTGLFTDIDDKFKKVGAIPEGDSESGEDSGGGDTEFGGGEDSGSEESGGEEMAGEEALSENILFESNKNVHLDKKINILTNKNKNLNTRTKSMINKITEALDKIDEETGLDVDGEDSLNSGTKND